MFYVKTDDNEYWNGYGWSDEYPDAWLFKSEDKAEAVAKRFTYAEVHRVED